MSNSEIDGRVEVGDIVLFIDPDRRSPTRDEGRFNQEGIVLANQRVVFLRGGKVVELAVDELVQLPGFAALRPSVPGLTHKIAAFFSQNRRRPRVVALGLKALERQNYQVFDRSDIMPVFSTTPSQNEHDAAWARVIPKLEAGDLVTVFEHNSWLDRFIAWLDYGAWSHAAVYFGNGYIHESVPETGVVLRPIDVYNNRFVRLGVYRTFGMTPEMAQRGLFAMALTVGRPYNSRGALKLGARKLLARLIYGERAIWIASGATPNDVVFGGSVFLVDYV